MSFSPLNEYLYLTFLLTSILEGFFHWACRNAVWDLLLCKEYMGCCLGMWPKKGIFKYCLQFKCLKMLPTLELRSSNIKTTLKTARGFSLGLNSMQHAIFVQPRWKACIRLHREWCHVCWLRHACYTGHRLISWAVIWQPMKHIKEANWQNMSCFYVILCGHWMFCSVYSGACIKDVSSQWLHHGNCSPVCFPSPVIQLMLLCRTDLDAQITRQNFEAPQSHSVAAGWAEILPF